MYTFNGVHTNKAVNEQVVGDGDKIVLHYTDDYTLEAGMVYTPADGDGADQRDRRGDEAERPRHRRGKERV